MEKVGQKNKLTSQEYGIAGATTGVVTRFLCQPLDVIKIRFQLQTDPISHKSTTSKYKSVLQATLLIAKDEKLYGLWKGHVPAQYLSVIYGAVQFSTYEALNEQFKSIRGLEYLLMESITHFVTGAASGVAATVASYPLDMIRTRLIAQGEPKVYRSILDATVKIYKKEGLVGFQRGLTPAIIQVLPSASLIFGFNHIFTMIWLSLIQKQQTTEKVKPTSRVGSFVCGSLAGICSKTTIYPLDLIKKRLQVVDFDIGHKHPHYKGYKGILDCAVNIIRYEGFLGLFKGLYPSLLKAGATNALYFSVYNEVCNVIYKTKR